MVKLIKCGSGVPLVGTSEAIRVAVGFTLPFVRDAVATHVGQDLRFEIVDPRAATLAGSVVALVDGVVSAGERRPLLSFAAVAGYVLLTRSPSSAELSRDPYGNLAKVELPLTAAWRQVSEAIQRVSAETCPASVQPRLPGRVDWRQQHGLLDSLSPREKDVLQLMAAGQSVREMARLMHLSPSTVDNHRSRLMKKLGVHKTVDAARFAYRVGLAQP